MGPLNWPQLSFNSVNLMIFADMSGPYLCKGTGRRTRTNPNTIKTWLLHTVCIVSGYNTIMAVEGYDAESFILALHRMACITGYPQIMYIDNSSTEIKATQQTTFSMMDIKNRVYNQLGITIRLCGVGGESHARHGRVERAVGLAKRYFDINNTNFEELTPLQLQSVGSQAASLLNTMPLCTKNKTTPGTTSSRFISPNSFMIGRRSNLRAPVSIPQLEADTSLLLDKVEKASRNMLAFFLENLPDLLLRPTWTKDSYEDLKIDDIVLFQYTSPPLPIKWKMGKIIKKEKDTDNHSRIYEIEYTNQDETQLPCTKEDTTVVKIRKRSTRRGCHTIVKIFSADDPGLTNDLASINRYIEDKELFTNTDDAMAPQEKDEEMAQLLGRPNKALMKEQMNYLMKTTQQE
jgi:hypothetical protein